jgi:ABC-2 type transport system permease protein
MSAIFKREFKSYFSTPIGYITLAIFFFFLGYSFSIIYSYGSPDIATVIMAMSSIVIFIIPVLTMRLMSEDKRQKVDQVLLTAPIKLSSVVLGKFFAALAVYAIGFAPTVIFQIIIACYVKINIMSYLYALLGVMLLGGVLIAVGMFISSLTESSVIAGVLTLVINILTLYISSLSSMISVPEGSTGFFSTIWAKIVEFFVLFLEKTAFITVFENFGENVFSIADVIYFLSIIAAFIFLSIRSLEKRRWA